MFSEISDDNSDLIDSDCLDVDFEPMIHKLCFIYNYCRYYYDFHDFDDDVAIQEYKQLVTKIPHQVSFTEALSDDKTRHGIYLGMIVTASQIFSGSMAVVSYSTS